MLEHLKLRKWKIIYVSVTHTCKTLLESPVFCASCLRSLASGFWLMAKYDFMVRNWWCLNDVLMRLVRCCCWPFPGEDTDESYASDSIDEDNSPGCNISVNNVTELLIHQWQFPYGPRVCNWSVYISGSQTFLTWDQFLSQNSSVDHLTLVPFESKFINFFSIF